MVKHLFSMSWEVFVCNLSEEFTTDAALNYFKKAGSHLQAMQMLYITYHVRYPTE